MTEAAHGPIQQIAYIVPDLDAGIDHWVETMRVGPFFKFDPIQFPQSDRAGVPAPLSIQAAIAYAGDVQIELIKPIGPSIFQEFLDQGRGGVHHFCVLTDDFQLGQEDLEARGGVKLQGAMMPDGSEIGYFEMPGNPVLVELACLRPAVLDLFGMVKSRSREWDGRSRLMDL